MQRLEMEILVNQQGHIDVAITGGTMLFKVLRDDRRDDLLYAMTSQTTYPGWGFMRENGATSIWEMWEKDLPGHSLLHSSYLYPGAWYIDGVAGIRKSEPGFRSFELHLPNLTETKMQWAKTEFDSPAGTIASYWKSDNGKPEIKVTVPPNCRATIYFPGMDGDAVHENSGVARQIGVRDGCILFEVPAGMYYFYN